MLDEHFDLTSERIQEHLARNLSAHAIALRAFNNAVLTVHDTRPTACICRRFPVVRRLRIFLRVSNDREICTPEELLEGLGLTEH